MVTESVVIQDGEKLIGLVFPDFEEAKNLGLNNDDIANLMEQNRLQLNSILPVYCKLSSIEIHAEEFEKTPKKSIKRFKYQR